MKKTKNIFDFDFSILISVTILLVISVLFVYSSGISSEGIQMSREYIKQIVWAATGFILFILFSFIDLKWIRGYAYLIYAVLLLLLISTLLFGEVINGARSWIQIKGFGIQPSEFMKLGLILFLARYLDDRQNGGERMALDGMSLVVSLTAVMVPVGLVLMQPDMGTALVYFPILLALWFLAGIRLRYLLFIILIGALTIAFIILPSWETLILKRPSILGQIWDNQLYLYILIGVIAVMIGLSLTGFLLTRKRIFYWISYSTIVVLIALLFSRLGLRFLKSYQLTRLLVFLDPSIDPQGAGWNVIQSITAVGSGGPWGKGFLQGTQSHYRFLPQQSTDFIFSIIAEEWGFAGSLFIFLLFFVIMFRSIYTVFSAREAFEAYICIGVFSILLFHFIVNIGMAMGIMPITGIPLLLLSYGGSSLWTTMTGLGLVSNIYLHRYKY